MRKIMKQEDQPEPKLEPSQIIPTPVSEPAEGKTIIGDKITIEGDIRGQENLVIEGSMKGKIELENHQVKVGPKGRLEGQILAETAVISGHVVGNIHASGKVKITKEANFSGEIKAKSISVEDGAYLKAIIELEREVKKVIPTIGKAASEPEKEQLKHQAAAGKKN
jgi:cytoskeletal protein CcmA (bactofilin family)